MKFFLAIAMMFVMSASAWAQSETGDINQQIEPEAINGQQVFQQTQPITLYSNKSTNLGNAFNQTNASKWIPLPNTQIVISNSQPLTAMISFEIGAFGNFLELFVDDKQEITSITSVSTNYFGTSHMVRLPAGKHIIELRAWAPANSTLVIGFREINVMTF